MKRDMDLVRKILLACETSPTGYAPEPLEIEGYDADQIGFHVMLMAQAGLISAHDQTHLGSTSPMWAAGSLTWQGYEFLDAARDDKTWAKAKGAVSHVAGLGFDVMKGVLVRYISDQALRSMG